MFALPALSGAELASILRCFGWRVRPPHRGVTVLQRGIDTVYIPEVATLGPHVVGALLRTAGISPGELVEHLWHHASGRRIVDAA